MPKTIDWKSEAIAGKTIESLLAMRPDAATVLLRHGMACVGCVMARFETLAEAAREYRLDPRELLKELRAADRSVQNHQPFPITRRSAHAGR
jgi:hybrid cluster-associated redox disulfide protein